MGPDRSESEIECHLNTLRTHSPPCNFFSTSVQSFDRRESYQYAITTPQTISHPFYAAILPRLSWLEISDAQVGIVEKPIPFPYQDFISLETLCRKLPLHTKPVITLPAMSCAMFWDTACKVAPTIVIKFPTIMQARRLYLSPKKNDIKAPAKHPIS